MDVNIRSPIRGSRGSRGLALSTGVLGVFFLVVGCQGEHPQSMLHPAGEAAARIAWLWWVLFGICSAVFIIVMALTGIALVRPRSEQPTAPLGNRFITVSGIFIPAVILVFLLVASVSVQVSLQSPQTNSSVRVIGHQYWWEVHYPEWGIVTANEMIIPVGEAVRLELTSADVIHSFWVPNLHGKMDMLPERTNMFWISADRPGVFRGQCAEYCGKQHAKMAFEVVALPPEEYQAWVKRNAEQSRQPAQDEHPQGRSVFDTACRQCHAVGTATSESKPLGPDLTLIGSRRTLGAATIPNNRENLEAWIRDPQQFKPGNKMPHTNLAPDDLRALLDYLQSLK